MESSSSGPNGRGPPKESSSSDEQPSSNRDAPPPRGDSPPRPTDAQPPPPHMMYYPPPMGYHGGHGGQAYPPGYAPYPTAYPPHQQAYNYPPPPPTHYAPPQTYAPSSNRRGFIRGFILCACVMFMFFFVTTLVMALVVHPELPIFKVVCLSVENFNATTTLAGKWDTKITVENPNEKLRCFFSDFKVNLMYKRDEVAVGFAPGFELGKHEQKQMEVRASSNVGNVDLDGMAKDRGGGSVTLSLRVSSMAVFKTRSVSTRGQMILATCEGLKVVFQNNSGNGTLDNSGKPIGCKLYI